jgi:hypothetical protein
LLRVTSFSLREAHINADLRAQVRSGSANAEQKLAVCEGRATLGVEDRVELLAVLAADSDGGVAERARKALQSTPVEQFVSAIGRADADPKLFTFCSQNLGDKPGITDAMAKNPVCPATYVADTAAHLTSSGIQSLLDNLEKFTSNDKLMVIVRSSPAATTEQRDLLAELDKGAPDNIGASDLAAIVAEMEPDPVKRETLMQRVSQMNVVERLTLALKGSRTERTLLIRDSNKLVQKCVLQSPRLTDSEVEQFAAMTNLPSEILRTIGLTRTFIKNYTVVRNLITNSKTPLDLSLHLLPRLNATDLAKLTSNKNVPETLRSTAVKLHRKRKMGLPGD